MVQDFGVAEDANPKGLRKAKKLVIAAKKNQKIMEDTHFVASPFRSNENVSVFAVFDGHAGALVAENARDWIADIIESKLPSKIARSLACLLVCSLARLLAC